MRKVPEAEALIMTIQKVGVDTLGSHEEEISKLDKRFAQQSTGLSNASAQAKVF